MAVKSKSPVKTAILKKGAVVTFTTGSRAGIKEHTGTVFAFVAKDQHAVLPKTAVGITDAPSNRDRYVVKVGDTYRYANAKSVK